MKRPSTLDLIRAGVPMTGGQDPDTAVKEMSIEDITGELETIKARASEIADADPTPEIVAEAEAMSERRKALKAEITRRETETAELTARRDAALAVLAQDEESEEAEEEAPESPDETPEVETPEAPDEEPAVETPTAEKAPVKVAASTKRKASAAHRPIPENVGGKVEALLATRSFKAGQALNTGDLGAYFEEARRYTGGDGMVRLAQYIAPTDPTRHLHDGIGSSVENSQKIEAMLAPQALVASGGYCAPLAGLYNNQGGISSAERPVRDALAQLTSDRGGVRFIPPVSFADAAGAITVWTAANDAAQTPEPATKACLVIDCETEQEVEIDAVVRCLTFGNFGARSFPERVAGALEATIAQHASQADAQLLATIAAGSTAVTAAAVYGAYRDVIFDINLAAVGYRERHRMAPGAPLDVLIPRWVREAMRDDILRQGPGDRSLSAADAEIAESFSVRGLRVTWILEDADAPSWAQGAGALTAYPTTVKVYIYAPGTWLFLDGGILDLGIVRDSTLNSTNDFNVWAETFEAAAMIGHESVELDITLCPSGEAAPLGTLVTC